MALSEELQAEQDEQKELAILRGKLEDVKKELTQAKRSETRAWQEVDSLEKTYGEAFSLTSKDLIVPAWSARKPRTKAHVGRPVLFLSDLHLGEVVEPRHMGGMNAYNQDIQHARFDRTINVTVDFCRQYTAGLTFDGITVPLGGDIFSGMIHDELTETNYAPMPLVIEEWVAKFVSAIKYLADEFGRVHLPCVDGNHDRLHKKKRAKARAEESWSFIFYAWLASQFVDDDRVDFTVSRSSEILLPIFDTQILLNHGDQTNGGQGIGGIYPPLMRWVKKSQSVYASQRKTFDFALVGHWHQLIYGQDIIVNGSMKGYDDYAKDKKFDFERPQQALFFITPENGLTMRTSIFSDSSEKSWESLA